MKTLLMVMTLAGCVAGSAWAERYADKYTSSPELQIDDGSNRVRQEYNAVEGRWETVQGEKQLKYNAPEDEWSYEDPDAQLQYNAPERKWEYPR